MTISPSAATITLTLALSLSGTIPSPEQAEAEARRLLAQLPDDPHQRAGRGAILLVTLRQRPDILRRLLASGEFARWPTLASLADGGATTAELLALLDEGA